MLNAKNYELYLWVSLTSLKFSLMYYFLSPQWLWPFNYLLVTFIPDVISLILASKLFRSSQYLEKTLIAGAIATSVWGIWQNVNQGVLTATFFLLFTALLGRPKDTIFESAFVLPIAIVKSKFLVPLFGSAISSIIFAYYIQFRDKMAGTAEIQLQTLKKQYRSLKNSVEQTASTQKMSGKYLNIIQGMNLGFDWNSNINTILNTATTSLKDAIVAYYRWDDNDNILILEKTTGKNNIVCPANKIRAGEGFIGNRYYERKAAIYSVEDVPQIGETVKNVGCFPFFTIDNHFIGALAVGFKSEGQDLEQEVHICSIIADKASDGLEKSRELDRTKKQANTDGLTGLYNRAYFDRRFPLELERSVTHNFPLSLVMIDVDWFKQINDTHGHQEGDQVLKTVGHVLLSTIRRGDLAFRFGGDEFCVILSGADSKAAEIVAKKIADQYSRFGYFGKTTDGIEKMSSLSIGVASYPEHAKTPDILFERADKAQYKIKKTTKNAVAVYYPGLEIELQNIR